MERSLAIPTGDGHLIHGVLTTPSKKTGVILVLVHGLTGHKNAHIFYNGARFFKNHGIATFRFDLYTEEPRGRCLTACTAETHARDVDTVIRRFEGAYPRIFVAGHSLGGYSAISADTSQMRGLILWDPSHPLAWRYHATRKHFRYEPRVRAWVVNWGVEHLIGKKMYERDLSGSPASLRMFYERLSHVTTPTKIICAGKGILANTSKDYLRRIGAKEKTIVTVRGADHNFNQEKMEEKLFRETLAWIRRWK